MVAGLEIRESSQTELKAVLDLQWRVLDEPFNRPRNVEPKEHDLNPKAIHVVALLDGRLVGAVRFEPHEGKRDEYLVRRMATEESYRGQGIGTCVMAHAERLAKKKGAKRIVLYARDGATHFYEEIGYKLTGVIKVHDTYENPEMVKDL